MAKATKYFVIDANGVEHTRNSNRVYTHALLVRKNLQNARDFYNGEKHRARLVESWQYANKRVQADFEREYAYYIESEETQAEMRADVAMGIAAFIAKKIAEEIALVDRDGTGEYSDFWGCYSWSGRLDLAQKQQAKWTHHGQTMIVETQTK
ncbi:hypothetical protein [Serratia liquefaciens]|uniref:hypothetical protein n=1 Tax=Serratia liquefaciens TaxID=614 RepID=UPI000E033B41|nr:hypothetical protein [Serratia liquefaciens]SUI62253.1 Uncharacterised protein [Serratia liquefaciens]